MIMGFFNQRYCKNSEVEIADFWFFFCCR